MPPKQPDPYVVPPPTSSAAPEAQKPRRNWAAVLTRAKRLSWLLAVIAALVLGLGGWWLFDRISPASKTAGETDLKNGYALRSLSPEELDRLNTSQLELGGQGNLLTFTADSTFKGKAVFDGDAVFNGQISADKNASFTDITIPGTSNLNVTDIKSTLKVAGNTTLQGSVVAQSNLSVSGGLNVAGSSSFGGALTAGDLNVRSATVNGNLTVNGHLITRGSTPTAGAGTAVGGGGTVSISGNDSAGTIAINTGSAPPAGIFINVTFRTPFSGSPKVILTPVGSAAGVSAYYTSRSANGFSIGTATAPTAGASYVFDYIVVQ